jgi:hypothetical protein
MMRLRFQAFTDLMHRYAAVWRAGWSIRDQLDAPEKLSYELAFQPAQLELVETPVHPAPHWAMRILVLLSVLILLIGIIGRLDIVVTAKGKFVPNERVKIIHPRSPAWCGRFSFMTVNASVRGRHCWFWMRHRQRPTRTRLVRRGSTRHSHPPGRAHCWMRSKSGASRHWLP